MRVTTNPHGMVPVQAGSVRTEPAVQCEPARSAASSSGLPRDAAGRVIAAVGQGVVAALAPLDLVVPAAVGPAPQVGTPSFYRWLLASQELLPRDIFDSQSHWHRMVALRRLNAAGHKFVLQGTCFDLGSDKPRAPQCSNCLQVFAVKSIHVTAKQGMVCQAVCCKLSVPLVGPQRLRPSRDYQVCGYKAHGSHQLGHFRGRVWCYACASSFAVTSARLPEAIQGTCSERIVEDTARRNLAFLVAGGLPPSWRDGGWPKGTDFGLIGFS